MKIFSLMSIILPLFCGAPSLQASPTDDIFLQTRTDQTAMDWLLDKSSGMLTNLKLGPGIRGSNKMNREWFFTAEELKVTPGFVTLQAIFSKVFHSDMNNAQLRVRIPDLSYDIGSVVAKAKSLTSMDPFLNLYSEVSMGGGIKIGLTSGMQLDLMIPNPSTKELESYLTALVEPLSVLIPKELPPAIFEIGYQAVRGDTLQFNQTISNLDLLPRYIRAHQNELVIKVDRTQSMLTADQIVINPVTVKLGKLSRTLNFAEFRPIIQSKLNDIIAKVIPALGDGLKTSIGPRILESIDSYETRSDFQFENKNLFARYSMGKFSNPAVRQVAFSISGHSCTAELYAQYKLNCVSKGEAYEPAREVSDQDHALAKSEVSQRLENGDAMIALSISEEYINRLLKTTIDAKLWDQTLDDDNLYLGEKGAFMVFNHASREPELILDLYYYGDGSRLQKFLINENKPIHFPLRMGLHANFELRNGSPFLVFKTQEVKSTQDEIINGLEEYGIESHLVWGFKSKTSKLILNMAGEMAGKTALEMELPLLKGMDLEKTWFETSPYGRINLYIKP